MLVFAIAFLSLGLARTLRADTTYTYTGNAYTECQGLYAVGGSELTPAGSPCAKQYAISAVLDFLAGTNLDNLPLTDITSDLATFSVTDGNGFFVANHFSEGNVYYADLEIATDANGNITAWGIEACTNGDEICFLSSNQSDSSFDNPTGEFGDQYSGQVVDNPGIWSTPEPALGVMLLVGAIWAALTAAILKGAPWGCR
jgi:hypothetical protein